MAVKIIMGLQYGDEGKGRVTHYEAQNASIVVRSTGGANAGHTVVANAKEYVTHLLPSAIIRPNVLSMIAPGVVADISVLSEEIQTMRDAGVKITKENFVISQRTQITLPHHKHQDRLEELLKDKKVGTTMRGIGPTYEDKAKRTNPRMWELMQDDDKLWHTLDENLRSYNILASGVNAMIQNGEYSGEEEFPIISTDEEFEYCKKYRKILKPFIANTQPILDVAIENKEEIIIEGAQSFWLDNDQGTYPMTTSSNPNASGTASGAGLGPTLISEVIGVIKAYTSRVGNGAFVTEQNNEIGRTIRNLGHEYGSTTGRPRRCGWLDLMMVKAAKNPNGLTGLCVNHLDTIGKLDKIKVCIAYKYKGRILDNEVPIDIENCEPIYKEFEGGWDTDGAKTFEELPEKAQRYIEFIEKYTGVPVKYIGIGADAEKTIIR